MTIALARAIAKAVGSPSETTARVIDKAILEYVRLTPQAATTPVTGPTTPASKSLEVVTVTSTARTMGAEDVNLVDDDTAGAEVTITLPPAADETYPRFIKKLGTTADVVVEGSGAETIDGALNATLTVQYEALMLISDGTSWHII